MRKDARYNGSYFVRWDKGAEPYISASIEVTDYFDCYIEELIGHVKAAARRI